MYNDGERKQIMIAGIRIDKVLEKQQIRQDTKARRRTNVSNTVANTTAEAIQAGITIEQLEALNVPVFRYQTQITIHGKLPDVTNGSLPYKWLVKNQNGSIGVKYAAIDSQKKKVLNQACRYMKTRMFFYSTSSETVLVKSCGSDKDLAIEVYKSIPEYIIGVKQMGCDCFGQYFVFCGIDAIYEKDMNALLGWYTFGEANNRDELAKVVQAANDKREQERLASLHERDIEKQEKEKFLQPIVETLQQLGYVKYDGPGYDGLILIRPTCDLDRTKRGYHCIEFKKYGKKFKTRRASSLTLEFDMPEKWEFPHKYSSPTHKGWKK